MVFIQLRKKNAYKNEKINIRIFIKTVFKM